MDINRLGLDRVSQKNEARLQKTMDAAKEPEPETGTYLRFDPNQPKGRQHVIRLGGNTVYGDMITPSTIASGQEVAVYRSSGVNLFDSL